MSRTKGILTLVGVIIVALIVWRVVAHRKAGGFNPSATDAPVPVTVVPASAENVPVYLTGTGTVTAINSVNVQPQVGGELMSLNFIQGQPVKKGQLLAQIDPRTLQAELGQAIGKLKQDEASLETAKANLVRSQNPKYAPYVAEINLITQRNTVTQDEASVAADKAAINQTQVQLGFTRITSPINGIAGIRQVTPGNVVTTATTIVTVVQMRPIYVQFPLAAKYMDEVRAAQARAPLNVAIVNPDGSVLEGDGKLTVINNQIDTTTSTFQLLAEFPNEKNLLVPGAFANTRLEVSLDSGALVVPTAAVERGPNGDYTWLVTDKPPPGGVTDGKQGAKPTQKQRDGHAPSGPASDKPAHYVTMQSITTGGEAGDTGMIVTKGLKAGDLVVTAGQFRLKQGSKILPLKPGEVPAPPTTAEIKAAAQHGGRGRR